MVKDIELDQTSSSFGACRIHGAKSKNQMPKSWGVASDAVDTDYSHLVFIDHDIEAVEEVKTEKPSSEFLSEKDLSVCKMEIIREFRDSQEEWNRRIVKRLAYEAKGSLIFKPVLEN